jgi:hypothetical protein
MLPASFIFAIVSNSFIRTYSITTYDQDEGLKMDQTIKAGISGLIIAVVITVLSPINLDFVPQLVAAIIAIYVFDLRTYKDGILAAVMTYLFSIGILGSVSLGILYASNQPIDFTIDVWSIIDQTFTPLTSLVAAYVGVWLAKMRRPMATPPPPPPPVQPL